MLEKGDKVYGECRGEWIIGGLAAERCGVGKGDEVSIRSEPEDTTGSQDSEGRGVYWGAKPEKVDGERGR